MNKLTPRAQAMTLGILALLVFVTRGRHFASVESLPSATWAAFFLGGLLLESRWLFLGLLAEVVLLDIASMIGGSGSNLCTTLAYPFIVPAYGALWFSGRWYAEHHQQQWSTLLRFVGCLFAATVVSQLLSSGSYYFLSGHFENPTLIEFAARFRKYYPQAVQALFFYLGLASLIYGVAAWRHRTDSMEGSNQLERPRISI